jgi:hypothetical protein
LLVVRLKTKNQQPTTCLPGRRPGLLDLSAAAESNSHLFPFDDDRYDGPVFGVLQHALQALLVFEDIDVIEWDLTPGVIRTGSRGVRSKVVSEDQHLFRRHGNHVITSLTPTYKPGRIKLQVCPPLCYFDLG